VFRRAGFVRHADLPVTQDEALRRRLNALVTTGDESGAADRLASELKDLRNRCRYNRTGLLPQEEKQRTTLENTLRELDAMNIQSGKLRMQLDEVEIRRKKLENHKQALAYEKYLADQARVEEAQRQETAAEETLGSCEADCRNIPSRQDAERGLKYITAFREKWAAAQNEKAGLPPEPQAPVLPMPFTDMDPAEAREMVNKDAKTFVSVNKTRVPFLLIVMGIVGLLAAGALVFLRSYAFAGCTGVVALIALSWGIWESISTKRKSADLVQKYGDAGWKRWAAPIDRYERELTQFQRDLRAFRDAVAAVEKRIAELEARRETLCGSREPEELAREYSNVISRWDALAGAQRELAQAKSHHEALSAMVKPVEKPAMEDDLTETQEETVRQLSRCALEQQDLQNRLGQLQGRMSGMGSPSELQKKLAWKNKRIARLEQTYAALTIAQETLAEARAELQRRFAPRITRRAQKLLADMTGGRYHTVTMSDDFSLRAGAGEEETLRDAIWRSDGTMDQLYLALRLAVAEELTPKAPLVLDDVLVRFDDKRMEAAVDVLKDLAENRQIILFTCQGREAEV